MIAGRVAPAKPSHLINVVDFQNAQGESRGDGEGRAECIIAVDKERGSQDRDESQSRAEEGGVKVQQWTKVAKSDNSPARSFTAEGSNPQGLIKTLAASGIQADAGGGWKAQETHHGQEPIEVVGSDQGRQDIVAQAALVYLVFDRWEALIKANSGAGRPTKKVKSPKSKQRP